MPKPIKYSSFPKRKFTQKEAMAVELSDLANMSMGEKAFLADALGMAIRTRVKNIEKSGLHSFALDKLNSSFDNTQFDYNTRVTEQRAKGEYTLTPEYRQSRNPQITLTMVISRELEFLHSMTSTVSGIRQRERQQDLFIFGPKYKAYVKDSKAVKSPITQGLYEQVPDIIDTETGDVKTWRYMKSVDFSPVKGKTYFRAYGVAGKLTQKQRDAFWSLYSEMKAKYGGEWRMKYAFLQSDLAAQWLTDIKDNVSFGEFWTEHTDEIAALAASMWKKEEAVPTRAPLDGGAESEGVADDSLFENHARID